MAASQSFLQYPFPTPSSPEETVPQLGPVEARPTTFHGLAEDPCEWTGAIL